MTVDPKIYRLYLKVIFFADYVLLGKLVDLVLFCLEMSLELILVMVEKCLYVFPVFLVQMYHSYLNYWQAISLYLPMIFSLLLKLRVKMTVVMILICNLSLIRKVYICWSIVVEIQSILEKKLED